MSRESASGPLSSTIYVGMDVHKDSVMVAVLPDEAPQPIAVDRLRNELGVLRRFLARLARQGAIIRACYEASGAGYVGTPARSRHRGRGRGAPAPAQSRRSRRLQRTAAPSGATDRPES